MNISQLIFNQVMGGLNPMTVLQRLGGNNPQAMAALNILNGKSPQQLQNIALNMCKERGTTPQEIAKSLGIKL